ncbi:MAG: chorismate mutase [Elusimicrobiales bacterium]|nr:chorismate mutase [Elusimicrobiales bacterium]
MANKDLETARLMIDEADRQIVALLVRRFSIAKSMAERKMKPEIYDAAREAEVLKKAKAAAGQEYSLNVAAVYGEIIKQSKKVQE